MSVDGLGLARQRSRPLQTSYTSFSVGSSLTVVRHGSSLTAVRQGARVPPTDLFDEV